MGKSLFGGSKSLFGGSKSLFGGSRSLFGGSRRSKSLFGRSPLGSVRRGAYKVGRVLGDVQAVTSGSPTKMAKRVGRKIAWKTVGKGMRKLFRD